ncbi:hypothetical protein [Mycobacteroides chelonae]|uniref:hypothetical protein n=1 Tax=Mycobacteroides chelonae TaxID=1774 RepID=UPI0009931500|nr:hypothetical protein [Mycobacteroides chelonae]
MTDAADFDAAIEKMAKIAKAVKEFESPEIQARVYATLSANAFGTPPQKQEPETVPINPAHFGPAPVDLDDPEPGSPPPAARQPARKTVARKGKKATYDVPKGVNYAPAGKEPLKTFAAAKQPTSNQEKHLVVVHWLQTIAERPVTTGEVIAAFNFLGWRNPADPVNSLQVTATKKQWLDTKDMNNIQVVWSGENYLQHDLPKPKK